MNLAYRYPNNSMTRLSQNNNSQNERQELRGLNKVERKRIQNRIAQRTYRQNQKQRMLQLEAAAAKSLEAETIPQLPASSQTLPNGNQNLHDGAIDPESDPELHSLALTTTMEDEFIPGSSWSNDPTAIWHETSPHNAFNHRNGQGALHIAVAADNEELITVLLDHGADVLKQDLDGNTALHTAAAENCEGALKLLLDVTPGPDARNNVGQTPLIVEVEKGHENAVFMLLRSTVDVNAKDALGNTALHLAVEQGLVQVAKSLLQNGANINA